MKPARQGRFKVGQVVAVSPYEGGWTYGEYVGIGSDNNELKIRFWDTDNCDYWEWIYEPKDVRPLNKVERGPK